MISPNPGIRSVFAALRHSLTPGSQITQVYNGTWRLEIPAGAAGQYRLAQLDDYSQLRREEFPWRPPISLQVRARASAEAIPGTWGIGLWNDPFSLSIGLGGGRRRLPALPNAAWFFFASPHNYLSLRDDLPASGSLAATFQSTLLPAPVMALSALLLPMLALPVTARLFRRAGRRKVRQDAASFSARLTDWHSYHMEVESGEVRFGLDGRTLYATPLAPIGPLGLVVWIDNQYAALPPQGKLSYGTLSNPEPAWIEIEPVE